MNRNAVCARVHQCGRSNEVLYRICILAHVVVVVGLHDPECDISGIMSGGGGRSK